ncbi:MAG: hypothetical protein GTN62_13610 [Gemmatimonadales bacterium]|nr:hypothetical protein [Gemmatimonadales bacterium]NIN13040.1 hypothetical protein [Gemmatimonadales bacterium]NIN51124.1 hypothetical protein [Gemmatimonadales bacterium]NIP08588.1 hypothetical protein [Gemmatimonadales bacterium]NIQ99698.1 hypothetical protein [Gemmatimonadales bacterium]
MRTILSAVSVAAVLLTIAVPVQAQREVKHKGFWISFGVGGGWNTTENIAGESLVGGAGYLRLGGTPNERFLIGGEAIAWVREENNEVLVRGNSTFSLLFYPSYYGGFFLKGGVGAASVENITQAGNVTIVETDYGFGATFGAGFDVRFARNFYLTPGLDFLFQRIDDSENALLLITVGVTWH